MNTRLKKNITKYKIKKMLYECITANTSAIWQQAAHTTYQLSSPSRSTRAIQKSPTYNQNKLSFLEKSQENGPLAEKWQERNSKRTREKQQERRQERGTKWQPWDSRQEDDIRHHDLPTATFLFQYDDTGTSVLAEHVLQLRFTYHI